MAYRIYTALLIAAVIAGCPYRVTARLPVPFRTLAVMPFENRTSELLSGYELTKKIKQEMIRRTTVSLGGGLDGMNVLSGTISKLSRGIISEDSSGTVVSERINLQVDVKLKTERGSETFGVIGTAVYEKQNLTSRAHLIQEALDDAARRITDRLIHMETPADVR